MAINNDTEIKHEIDVFRAFKKHFILFVGALSLFWVAWLASGGELSLYSWPAYASLAWAFVLIVHLLIAYSSFRKTKNPSLW